jgi:hypothetical protein
MEFHLREGSPVEKNSACEVLIYGYVTVERRLLTGALFQGKEHCAARY